jgi:hemoglobin
VKVLPELEVEGCLAMRPDLDTRVRIRDLVVSFYREVAMDELLAPVFCDVAHVNWSVHIPKLVDYWCRVLLGHPGYEGRLLEPHQRVHAVEAFGPELFDRWYSLFVEEIDRAWQGPVAESAKAHAARMATILARRLLNIEWESSMPDAGPFAMGCGL